MDQIQQRMRLSPRQRHAVIQLDDHGVHDPVPLFVMDFDTWQLYQPENFFNYFADAGTVASYATFKPCWQRYQLLYPLESQVLKGIYDRLNGDKNKILNSEVLSKRFYSAYVLLSTLVDELDAYVDQDIRKHGEWNHGYVINDTIIV